MPQAVKHDAGELRVLVLPLLELLPNQDRLNSQTIGQAQEHSFSILFASFDNSVPVSAA